MDGSRNSYEGLPKELGISLKSVVGDLVREGAIFGDDADDLEQDLAIRGLRALGRYRPESGVSLGCFLQRVLRRRAISLLGLRARRERRHGDFLASLGAAADPPVSPHEALVSSLDLQGILARLPPDQRELVRLLERHPFGQVAGGLGVSRSSAYRLLRKVRQALRQAGYTPPTSRRQSKREKLPMPDAATTQGAPAPASPAVAQPTEGRMKTSYSMWSLFRNCRRAARFRYLDNIVPIERDPNLAFGSLIHQCLELWHGGRGLGAVLEHIDTACARRHASEPEQRDWHCARAMMTGYARAHPTEEFEVVALEQVFDAEIVNPRSGLASRSFTISGKVDGIIRIGEQYFLLEHKTAAQLGADYLERLWTDFQITLYAHYVEQTMGIRVSGILYNILLKTRLQQAKGETEEEFEARRVELLAKSKTGRSSAKRRLPESDEEFAGRLAEKYAEPGMFHREMLYLPRDRFEQLRAELWELTQAFLHARRVGAFYQNTSYCFQYGRPCAYFALCRSGESTNVLENLYTTREPHEELRPEGGELPEAPPVF